MPIIRPPRKPPVNPAAQPASKKATATAAVAPGATRLTNLSGDDHLIVWNNDMSVGVEDIDNQHQVLIGLLNKIMKAVHQRQGHEILDEVIINLGNYTRVHFTVEESLMRLLDYPTYEQHRDQHQSFITQLHQMKERFRAGDRVVSFELASFLKNWLLKHILETDKRFGQFCLERGASTKLSKNHWQEHFSGIFQSR